VPREFSTESDRAVKEAAGLIAQDNSPTGSSPRVKEVHERGADRDVTEEGESKLRRVTGGTEGSVYLFHKSSGL
jgi:hypothetical protein